MYENGFANVTVIAATLLAVGLSVLTHYEGLIGLSTALETRVRHPRAKVFVAILALLVLHVLEIWIFGVTLWSLLQWPACGSLSGASPHLFDAVYFSAVTYTTVGYGDLSPSGPIRLLAGTEALVGLVLITWSASFTFLEMARFWESADVRRDRRDHG